MLLHTINTLNIVKCFLFLFFKDFSYYIILLMRGGWGKPKGGALRVGFNNTINFINSRFICFLPRYILNHLEW